jgi:hypothetical protein
MTEKFTNHVFISEFGQIEVVEMKPITVSGPQHRPIRNDCSFCNDPTETNTFDVSCPECNRRSGLVKYR